MDLNETAQSCSFLNEPISISDLIGSGSKFEVNAKFNDWAANDMFEELGGGSDDDDDDNTKQNIPVAPWTESFDKLRQIMEPIDQYIYKRIVKPGCNEGGPVPLGARVEINYNAYWENDTAPFDSTFLRGATMKFYTGYNAVLEGIETAVRSMHRGEHAQFVISYQLLYRELGCPPRIKPKADALFLIEVVSYTLVGDLHAEQKVPEEDRDKFSVAINVVKDVHLRGVDFFTQGYYKNAAIAFEKAVNMLLFCRLSNEEEELVQTEFLIKLYTNLAVCYLKTKMPAKTCIMCKEIRRLTNNKPNCKALFQEGRALHQLGEYARARNILVAAQRLEPHNNDINQELKMLNDRYARYKKDEREIWRKAMGVKTEEPTIVGKADGAVDDLTNSFEMEMRECIKSFKESSGSNTLKLPIGLTEGEIEVIDKLAKQFDLLMSQSHLNSNAYSLVKNKPE